MNMYYILLNYKNNTFKITLIFISYKFTKWTFCTCHLTYWGYGSERILINMTMRDQEEGVTLGYTAQIVERTTEWHVGNDNTLLHFRLWRNSPL